MIHKPLCIMFTLKKTCNKVENGDKNELSWYYSIYIVHGVPLSFLDNTVHTCGSS